jgi:hypothetical protein
LSHPWSENSALGFLFAASLCRAATAWNAICGIHRPCGWRKFADGDGLYDYRIAVVPVAEVIMNEKIAVILPVCWQELFSDDIDQMVEITDILEKKPTILV